MVEPITSIATNSITSHSLALVARASGGQTIVRASYILRESERQSVRQASAIPTTSYTASPPGNTTPTSYSDNASGDEAPTNDQSSAGQHR